MNLPKAIEICTDHNEKKPILDLDDLLIAIQLLIEAGKRTMSNRDSVHPVIDQLLPGETEE